jgi:Putative binding domain, N-terminal/Viral BACON domain
MTRNARAIHGPAIFGTQVALLAGTLALTSCGSSANSVTSPSTLSKCAVTVDVPRTTVPATGGAGSIGVQTERECQWTAQPDVSWLSITAGSTGQGAGSVQFNVVANVDPAGRTGGVMVNDQRAQVTQAAAECKFELSSNATSLPQAGGTGTVDVRASSALCTWTATSDVPWISITSNANGKGSAPVAFSVASTTGPPRSGTLTIAGLHFSVPQSQGCAYTVSPATFALAAAGGSLSVTVTAGAGCPWTASSNQPWITITSGSSGSGAGTVTFNVAAADGPSRSGTLTVAGQTVTVTQGDGCTFAISSDAQSVPASGGSGSVSVVAPPGCAWTAASNLPWISITAGASGTGNGTVNFTVASTSGPGRSGTLTIAGRTFTVNQGQGCTYSISPAGQTIPAAGGSGSFVVNTSQACAWTATAGATWISITSGTSGNGPGNVQFTAAANAATGRTGTITAGGQVFTVTQQTICSAAVAPETISVPASGGSRNVTITTPAECAWTAVSNAAWISIAMNGSGSGNSTIRLDIQPNSGPARNGTAAIAGRSVTVNQDSVCLVSINPSSRQAPAGKGGGLVSVTAGTGCTWTAVSGVSWIDVTSGASGSGTGTVQYTFDKNNGKQPRSGTIAIGGHQFTITQTGS